MEIRQVLRGTDTSFAASRSMQKAEDKSTVAACPSGDRVELSRQWVDMMREQSARIQSLLSQPAGQNKEKKSEGILDMLDGAEEKSEELDALSQDLKVKMKCLKIAMNIMKGKKVPPEDERYLMENDPAGYKLAMAMKAMVKEDDEECESVLDDEDKNGGETSETEGDAPAESSSGSGEAVSSGEEE